MKYSKYIKFWDYEGDGNDDLGWTFWVLMIVSCAIAIPLLLFADISVISVICISLFFLLGLFCLLMTRPFSNLISYPFRYIKIRYLIKSNKCFTRKSAGLILLSYVYNGNAGHLEHDWDGCKCKRCDKTRDEQHDWDGCKCKRCDKIRDEQHNWDGCKCKRCGKVRDEQHDWDGCKCKRCYKIGFERHDWNECKCKRCGYIRDDQHEWIVDDISEYEYDDMWHNETPCKVKCTTTTYRCRKCGKTESRTGYGAS